MCLEEARGPSGPRQALSVRAEPLGTGLAPATSHVHCWVMRGPGPALEWGQGRAVLQSSSKTQRLQEPPRQRALLRASEGRV